MTQAQLGGTWKAVLFEITYDGGVGSSNVLETQKKKPGATIQISTMCPAKETINTSGTITIAGDYDTVSADKRLEKAVLAAYKQLEDNTDPVTAEIKKEHPKMETIEYWWLKKLVDRLSFN